MLPKVWATSVVLLLEVSTVVSAASHGPLPRPPGVGPYHTPFWHQVAPNPVPWRGMRGAGVSAQLGLGAKARGQLLVQSAVRPAPWQVSALRSSQVESRLLRIFRLSSFLPSSRGPRNWDASPTAHSTGQERAHGVFLHFPDPSWGCRPQSDAFPATLSRYVGSSL